MATMADRKFDSHDRSDYTTRGITIQGKKSARKVSISGSPANYRAATWLGHHRDKKADASPKKLATDVIPVL